MFICPLSFSPKLSFSSSWGKGSLYFDRIFVVVSTARRKREKSEEELEEAIRAERKERERRENMKIWNWRKIDIVEGLQ